MSICSDCIYFLPTNNPRSKPKCKENMPMIRAGMTYNSMTSFFQLCAYFNERNDVYKGKIVNV